MKDHYKLLVGLAMVVLSTACASQSNPGGGGAAVPAPTATPTTTTTSTTGSATSSHSGSTAVFTPTSTSELAKMFFNSNPNNPTNVTINIDFNRTADTIYVSYTDGGQIVEASFGTVHPYSGYTSNEYNAWVSQSGKQIYKGFFQDQYGAVILIVDHVLSQGDGTAGNILGGSLWFQNFNRYAPNNPQQGPLKMCWEISMGPYDCRSFLVGDTVSVLSSYYPNNRGPDANMNYEQLGTFSGIFRDSAHFQ